jgi:methionyl-tRNA synthetase
MLIKQTNDHRRLKAVLYLTYDTLRVCGILLQPIIPTSSAELLDRLGVVDRHFDAAVAGKGWPGPERKLIKSTGVLFKPLQ